MTIEQKGIVDLIAVPPEGGTASLIISDHLGWDDDSKRHKLLIQEKVNEYLNFIEGGMLFETRPDLVGKRLIIKVVGLYLPSEEGEFFYRQLQNALAQNGYPFIFELYNNSNE